MLLRPRLIVKFLANPGHLWRWRRTLCAITVLRVIDDTAHRNLHRVCARLRRSIECKGAIHAAAGCRGGIRPRQAGAIDLPVERDGEWIRIIDPPYSEGSRIRRTQRI